jgi:WD40 repeat protein
LSVLALPECAVLDEMPFEAAISALAFSRDGIVVCCENGSGSVLTWDAEAGKAALYQLLPFAENPALEVVYSPDDGERFIVSDGETARVYDETGAYLYSLTGSGTSLQFNSAGDTVAGISAGELRFWDFRTGASQRGLPGYNRFYLRPDDSIVAIKDKKFEIIRYGTPVFFHIYYGDDWLVLDKRNNKAIVSENAERHLVVQTTQGDRAFGLSETDETLVERKTKL